MDLFNILPKGYVIKYIKEKAGVIKKIEIEIEPGKDTRKKVNKFIRNIKALAYKNTFKIDGLIINIDIDFDEESRIYDYNHNIHVRFYYNPLYFDFLPKELILI